MSISDCDSQRPQLLDSDIVGPGFPERTDTGLRGLYAEWVRLHPAQTGILYVADSLDNRIAAISRALYITPRLISGITVFQGWKAQ